MAQAILLREPLGQEGIGWNIRVGKQAKRIDVRDGLIIVELPDGRTIWLPLSAAKMVYP